MMMRKWAVLAATVATVALVSTGLSLAADEEGLAGIMEKVSATNNKLNRAVRTKVTFQKAGKEVVEDAELLSELGKQAKEYKDEIVKNAEGIEDPGQKWDDIMDEFINSSSDLAKTAATGDQAKSKMAHNVVKKACAECHKVFRIDDDDF